MDDGIKFRDLLFKVSAEFRCREHCSWEQ